MANNVTSISNRISALIIVVEPPHSLAARIRAIYEYWNEKLSKWHKSFEAEEDAYATTVNGEPSPFEFLRAHIGYALYGDIPRILEADSFDEAERKYHDYIVRGPRQNEKRIHRSLYS